MLCTLIDVHRSRAIFVKHVQRTREWHGENITRAPCFAKYSWSGQVLKGSQGSNYFPRESQCNTPLRDEGQVAAESNESDSWRTTGSRARETKLHRKQSYRERLIWDERKSWRGPMGRFRSRNCVCVTREKRWNFAKKLLVHDSLDNRNAFAR